MKFILIVTLLLLNSDFLVQSDDMGDMGDSINWVNKIEITLYINAAFTLKKLKPKTNFLVIPD